MRRIAFTFVCTLLLSGPALGAAGDVLTVIGDRVNVRSGPSTERDVTMQVSRNQRLVEIGRQGDWVHAEIGGTSGADGWIHGSLVAPPNGEPVVTPAAPQALAEEAPRPPSTAAEPAPAGETASLQSLEDATDAAAAEPEPPPGATAGPSAPPPATAGAAPGTDAIAPGAGAEIEAVDLQRFRDSVAYLNSRAKSIAGVDLFTEVEPLGAGAVQVGATDAWADMPPAGQRSYATALLDRWAAATGRADQLTVQIVDRGGQVIMEQSKP
jgi:Bacterial SH3 domain